MGAALRRNQFNDELVSLYVPSLNFPESWTSEAAYEVERLRCLFLDAKQAFEALRDDTPDSPTPHAKGAQPEQLVELKLFYADDECFEIRYGDEVLITYSDIDTAGVAIEALKAVDYSTLATALSESREERERADLIRDTAAAELREARDHQYEKRKEAEAALSECRERRDEYQVRARAAARVISRRGLIPEYDYEYELLTAQPPSEASETP